MIYKLITHLMANIGRLWIVPVNGGCAVGHFETLRQRRGVHGTGKSLRTEILASTP